MTIKEMLEKKQEPRLDPPGSIFAARHPEKGETLMCIASFEFKSERDVLLKLHPDLMEWEVTKEHFTREELDAWKSRELGEIDSSDEQVAQADAMSFEPLHAEYLRWVKATFPTETVSEQMAHLDEEFDELISGNWDDPSEFADVLMLLCCVAHGQGIDIIQAFRDKFAINKERSWEKTERGFRHIPNK